MKLCKNCGKKTNGDRYNFCCNECKDTFFNEYRECKTCKTLFKTRKKTKKQFCSVKCLTTNSDVKLKMVNSRKKVFLEKYGKESYTQTKDFINKTKRTNFEKYGVEYPQQCKQIRDKKENTNLIKYGYKNAAKNLSVIEKINKTRLSRFNNSYFGIIAKKRKKEIYGNENYNNMEKNKKTCLEKYGVDNVSNTGMVKEKIREKHLNTFYNKLVNDDKFKKMVMPLFSLDEYKGVYSTDGRYLYEFKCNTCNTEFECKLGNGDIPRCPICFPYSISKPQQEILTYIKSILPLNEEVINNDRTQIAPLELDIYIPGKSFAIEYDSFYWHSEDSGGKVRGYHIEKTLAAKEKGIRLVHIFEDEWRDRKEVVKKKLCHLLKIPPIKIDNDVFVDVGDNNCNNKSIYARNCKIVEIDVKTASKFIEDYHIQGYGNCKIRLGAYYNGELVSVMTFGCRRVAMGMKNKNIGKDEYEMIRFCVGDKNVVGIAGKLFNYFINNYNPSKIISYADRRWSDESAFYGKIGMKFVELCAPNYFYFKVEDLLNKPEAFKRWHRFSFRKDQLNKRLEIFDENLTEWENCKINGFDRIWDCGNLKYEWLATNNNKII